MEDEQGTSRITETLYASLFQIESKGGENMIFTIEKMMSDDWNDVARIYLEGISTGNATFQTAAPTWDEWNNGHCCECRLVIKIENKVIGWASLSKVSSREVYSGVAEVSVYLDSDYKGNGFGSKLLNALVDLSEKNGYWTLQAGIFPENVSSIAIHKKCGFRQVGIRENLGKMTTGEWRNVAFLERRSKTIGR